MGPARALAAQWLLVLLVVGAGCCAAASGVDGGAALFDAPARLVGPRRRLLGAPDPLRMLTAATNCAEWPEPRVYIEGQAWFTRCAGGNGGRAGGRARLACWRGKQQRRRPPAAGVRRLQPAH